jgi:hypothetical protein
MTPTVNKSLLGNYMRNLVNLIFKILPIRESDEPSLKTYMESLQAEVLGCECLIRTVESDPLLLSLAAILQYLIDNPEGSVLLFRREVFKAISICNKLKSKYAVEGG